MGLSREDRSVHPLAGLPCLWNEHGCRVKVLVVLEILEDELVQNEILWRDDRAVLCVVSYGRALQDVKHLPTNTGAKGVKHSLALESLLESVSQSENRAWRRSTRHVFFQI
eukprot:Amastigsp_a676545_51.p2 type:complete len:111 gc:universal Amastigsp_a676545_51:360-28(-)